ncbi:DUF2922 domain-containing protein [Enterococcus sp. 669A]|uniref:DUF2922 domain-containing protein n=1 Tax=Candidatus Enterococcus moelleringii TaxID=2815325 RepID=A0ABS3LDA9_9ENTE|nr:DUF2922 domain-containing protein [Enterococcus sp. 669A]MBO1307618.1 DUF2922 domain-containing protein [Enterococcus sp. 669A]
MIKLASTFLNSEGKKHTLNIKNPDIEKSPEEIREALTLLTELDIFEKDGVGLFEEVVSAKFVETVETPIFKLGEFFGDPDQPIVLNQPLLTLHSKALELAEPEKEVIESTLPEQPLQFSPTYKELPEAPVVTLDLPGTNEPEALKLEEPMLGKQNHSTNVVKKLFQNKIAKRRRRQGPPG